MYKLINLYSTLPLPMHEAKKNINNYNELHMNYNSHVSNIYWKGSNDLYGYNTSLSGRVCEIAPKHTWHDCIWEISILMTNNSTVQMSIVDETGGIVYGQIGTQIIHLSDGEEPAVFLLSTNTDYVWKNMYIKLKQGTYGLALQKDDTKTVVIYQIFVKRYKDNGTI